MTPLVFVVAAIACTGVFLWLALTRNAQREAASIEGVRQRLRDGKKLAAIQMYRHLTGVDLAEATRQVEDMQERLQAADDDAQPSSGAQ